MSARKCRGCGQMFSVRMPACPACGANYEVTQRPKGGDKAEDRQLPLQPCGCGAKQIAAVIINGLRIPACEECYTRHFYNGKLPPKINEWGGPTEYGKRISKEILAKLRQVGHRRPNREWAARLLARAERGELMPNGLPIASLAVQWAREVVARGQRIEPQREPGSDDE